jgi:hypothetical protein
MVEYSEFEKQIFSLLELHSRCFDESSAIFDRCTPKRARASTDCVVAGMPQVVVPPMEAEHYGFDAFSHEIGHTYFFQCKALDYSIEQLSEQIDSTLKVQSTMRAQSCVANFRDEPHESGIEWFALDAELRATKKRLSKQQLKKLIRTLRHFRRIFEEVHKARGFGYSSMDRWLAQRAQLRTLLSFTYAILAMRCSAESFSIGTVAQFDRGKHFLTDTFRKTSLLWGRVVASLSGHIRATRTQSVPT